METAPQSPRTPIDLPKMAPLLAVLIVFLLIPLKISSLGYFPLDDALRHVAHAIDGRPWGDILVLRPELAANVDNHPGWHAFLGAMHRQLGLSADSLVTLSYFTTFIAFGWCGVFASRSPLAWLCASASVWLVEPGFFSRLLLGRPFAITMAAEIVVLFYLTYRPVENPWKRAATLSLILVPGLWAHPSAWYLWALVPAALFVVGRIRDSFVFAGSLVVTLFLVAICTDTIGNTILHPVVHLFNTLGADPIFSTNLVSELQPSGAPVFPLLIALAVLIVQSIQGGSDRLRERLASPDFIVFIGGWLLGLSIMRFWVDWGTPAFLVWLTRQFVELPRPTGIRRQDTVWISLLIAAAFYLGSVANLGGRYSSALRSVLITKSDEELKRAMPDEGGVMYSLDMGVFYKLFYRFPHAKVRYMVGYEPGMMPDDDLKTMRTIQSSDGALEAYRPWFDKMSSADRVLMYVSGRPEWPGMEFEQFYSSWIGKKVPPKTNSNAPAEPHSPSK